MSSELAPSTITKAPGSIAESRCLVIGAASGIGLATAERLRTSGAVVVGADLPSARWPGDDAGSLPMDVTDPESVRAAVASAARTMGGLDAVVNCAGILGPVASALSTSLEEFERNVRINLTGAFIVSQAVLPAMAEAGYGRLAAHVVHGGQGRRDQHARLLGQQGRDPRPGEVTREGICALRGHRQRPGPRQRHDTAVPAGTGRTTAAQAARIPMGRFGTPAEAAAIIEFIVSPAASYTTGFVFDLSGGRATY